MHFSPLSVAFTPISFAAPSSFAPKAMATSQALEATCAARLISSIALEICPEALLTSSALAESSSAAAASSSADFWALVEVFSFSANCARLLEASFISV